MGSVSVIRDPAYCATCYGAAKKAGRPVRQTDVYRWPICSLCESRFRNGMIHYVPSNGTEGMMFEERCADCRHCSEHEKHGYPTCAFGILDKMMASAWEESDSAKTWWAPEDLRTRHGDGAPMCPAECLRFTHRSDPDGERRDPPPRDCDGQLFFSDILVVEEPARRGTAAMAQAK